MNRIKNQSFYEYELKQADVPDHIYLYQYRIQLSECPEQKHQALQGLEVRQDLDIPNYCRPSLAANQQYLLDLS
jgi:hypothetical protein